MQWISLIALSAALAALWGRAGLPAAFLLGPMFAGIILAVRRVELNPPRSWFLFAQGLIGCLMARGIPVSIIDELAGSWHLFIGGTLWALAVSAVMGWILIRKKVLPGTTAIWGISPGAASAMVVMSEDYGGDMRLVAFMQYLRVVIVSVAAAMVAHWLAPEAASAAGPPAWSVPTDWPGLARTMAFNLAAVWLGRKLRIPGGPILLPMFGGIVLHNLGLLSLELPVWLMALTYAVIGWSIGLRFSAGVISTAFRVLPKLVLVILVLTAACALFGGLMVLAFGFDPLTAYLATCPGGLDTVAIIASSARVNFPFIMTMQTVRMLLVFFLGPVLSRFMIRRIGPPEDEFEKTNRIL